MKTHIINGVMAVLMVGALVLIFLFTKDSGPGGLQSILKGLLDTWEEKVTKDISFYQTNVSGIRYTPFLTNGYWVGVITRPIQKERIIEIIAYGNPERGNSIDSAYVGAPVSRIRRVPFPK